jgi:DNA-binding transcriptional LysR family regulator
MKWDDIKIFDACMRLGSLSAAAQSLDVQQSTVSRRIQALEDNLGGALFIRTSEGIVPTSLAEKLAGEASAMQLHFHALERLASGHEPAVRGEVKISLVEPMALYLLLPYLDDLKKRYPELSLDLITEYTFADLNRLEADIALRFVRPDKGDLIVKKLVELPLRLLASRDYIASHGMPSADSGRWVNVSLPGLMTPEEQWYAEHIRVPPWLQTSSYVVAAQAILSGQCVGLTTGVMSQISEGVLQRFELPDVNPPEDLEVWLVTHATMRHTPRVAAVWEWLCELFLALDTSR